MSEHAIEGIMKTTMSSLREMIDVNTIIGEPFETKDGSTIIPISKVAMGFASGGSEFGADNTEPRRERDDDESCKFPFGGGTGAGISLSPVAFMIINKEHVRILPVTYNSPIDKVIDFVPGFLEEIRNMVAKGKEKDREKDKDKDKDCCPQEAVINPA